MDDESVSDELMSDESVNNEDCPRPRRPMHHSPLYQYDELKSSGAIRILELHPGKLYDPLRCLLKETQLSRETGDGPSCPEYEALSYAWGDPRPTEAIIINTEWHLPITESLADALRNLRHPVQRRYLWADAVCIDQENLAEKAEQVSMMARIYHCARACLVWLGTDPHFDKNTFEWVASSSSSISRDGRFRTRFEASSPKYVARGLVSLFMRPWWKRLWVLQESSDRDRVVVCSGQERATWHELSMAILAADDEVHRQFKEAWTFAHQNKGDRRSRERDLIAIWQSRLVDTSICMKRDDPENDVRRVMTCLLNSLDRDCTDPRDRIYAIRSIAGLEDVAEFQPDYKRDPLDLYRAFTLYMIRKEWYRDGINRAIVVLLGSAEAWGAEAEREEGWRTWVPNLHGLRHAAHARRLAFDEAVRGRSGRDCLQISLLGRGGHSDDDQAAHQKSLRGCEEVFLEVPHLLGLVGCPIGRVNSVLSHDEVRRCVGPSDGRSRSTITLPEATRLVVSQAFTATETPLDASNWLSVRLEAALQVIYGSIDPAKIGNYPAFYDAVETGISGKWTVGAVVNASGGKFAAWVPVGSRYGDEVWCFSGSAYPFVVRDLESRLYWAILGDCPVSETLLKALEPQGSCISTITVL